MEFKMSKESEDNLKKWIQEEENKKQRLIQESLDRKKKHKLRYGFKSAQELINWVLSGKRIVNEQDTRENISLVDDKIRIVTEHYNDIDMPIGYIAEYKTIEEFKNWIFKVESQLSQQFYLECPWEKEWDEGGE